MVIVVLREIFRLPRHHRHRRRRRMLIPVRWDAEAPRADDTKQKREAKSSARWVDAEVTIFCNWNLTWIRGEASN